jgi:hypothetical protein
VQDRGDSIQVYGQVVARDLFEDIYMVPIADILNDVKSTLGSVEAAIFGRARGFSTQKLGDLVNLAEPIVSVSAMRRLLDLRHCVRSFRVQMPSQLSEILEEEKKAKENPFEVLWREVIEIQTEREKRKTAMDLSRLRKFLESFKQLVLLCDAVSVQEDNLHEVTVLISASARFLITVRSALQITNQADNHTRLRIRHRKPWMAFWMLMAGSESVYLL